MTTTTSASATSAPTDITGIFDSTAGSAQDDSGLTVATFLASLATAAVLFGIFFVAFYLLRGKLTRIYQPKTYLVPERDRITAPPKGFFSWMKPIFQTSDSEFMQKCGLDAYFFIRYLRLLLRIFVPIAVVILPILLPINHIHGIGSSGATSLTSDLKNVTGLDTFGWTNIKPSNSKRYWAHLVLAVGVIVYVCFVFFDELKRYVQLRQAYLTSPQHRLKASATTVLVSGIPKHFLTAERLADLYDCFPGGVRNIWINRDFDELAEKVKERNRVAKMLESAETDLVKKAVQNHKEQVEKENKKNKVKKRTKEERKQDDRDKDASGQEMAYGEGIDSGNPHQAQSVGQVLEKGQADDSISHRGVTDVTGDRAKNLMAVEQPSSVADSKNAELNRVQPEEEKEVSKWKFWRAGSKRHGPTPPMKDAIREDDERPITGPSPNATPQPDRISRESTPTSGKEKKAEKTPAKKGVMDKLMFWRSSNPDEEKQDEPIEYPVAIDEKYEKEDGEDDEPKWKKYIKPEDRDTSRLPIFGWTWMPSLPLMGQKVDTIYWCRKELARLNLEIETDQQDAERFPLMNSAFVQFNHQIAAHMCCQSVSHHLPKHMAPRTVEISPDDVIWDNMSIRWWERYVRTSGVFIIVVALIIGWAIPVTFTGLVSQVDYLAGHYSWLAWLKDLPEWVISIIQGVLPAALLSALLAVLPIILRLLARTQGVNNGMAVELSVQNYYFGFLFVQVFLVVSLSSGLTTIIQELANDPISAPTLLAQNLPKAGNYFFSYMLLQAFSVSGGALAQLVNLAKWFLLANILDSTARQKWKRQITLPRVKWGTFFPVYTNLACIGLVYCVISPLILIFNIITFSLFWVVFRYNTLYVTRFRFDTGGLLFPRAINQLFTGLYVMELCLIGLFFLQENEKGTAACTRQAIIMIVVFLFTILYQFLLNEAFGPLVRYMPITLEDDAFAREERQRLSYRDIEPEDFTKVIEERDNRDAHADEEADAIELEHMHEARKHHSTSNHALHLAHPPSFNRQVSSHSHQSWGSSPHRRSKYMGSYAPGVFDFVAHNKVNEKLGEGANKLGEGANKLRSNLNALYTAPADGGLIRPGELAEALFAGINDEITDLTPDERDQLVHRAYLHEALRARRPAIWIPRDDLGVSDDEILRTERFTKRNVWISNAGTGLDAKGNVLFRRSPPDFSELDLIEL